MIVVEEMYVGDIPCTRTYSDSGRYVVRDGIKYVEAIDPAGFGRTYTEGDLMPEEERGDLAEKAAAYDILMGVTE